MQLETKQATFEVIDIDYTTVQDIFVIFVASGGTAASFHLMKEKRKKKELD